MIRSRPRGSLACLATLLVAAFWLTGSAADELPSDVAEDAASHLVFDTQLDNYCMRLSPGGKLVVMTNSHPHRSIRYRLVRVFADRHQPGLNSGIIEAGAEPLSLGCNKVNHRDQHWEVRSARYED